MNDTLVIRPTGGRRALDLAEVWRYRGLLYFFVWRDLKVRYKQTLLGAAWSVLQPLLTMLVFTLFFGKLAKVPSDGVPYPIFSYTALVPWGFFAAAVTSASASLVGNSNLLRKIYFPRVILPVAATLSAAVDSAIAFVVLLGLMFHYDFQPTVAIVAVVPLSLVALVAAVGVGTLLSAVNVRYRDVKYTTPFMIQIWLFCTPIAYPASLVPEHYRALYALNPMVGVVEGYRWSLLGTTSFPGTMLLVSALVSVGLLLVGARYFARVERSFADVV